MQTIVQEKVNQAISILDEMEIDLWLTFVRETAAGGDPILPLIYGHDLTWQTALILTRSGKSIAILGQLESETARRTGAYQEIISYDEAIRNLLLEVLQRLNPNQIALNYSKNDVHADGLTYGSYQLIIDYLDGTHWIDRIISSERVIGALRGRKTTQEIERIKTAINTTETIYNQTIAYAQPGMTER
ncbi:aminopeptidase P family protein, partial [bacterium]|nr:aminopeptidase P family protein [bacterium]